MTTHLKLYVLYIKLHWSLPTIILTDHKRLSGFVDPKSLYRLREIIIVDVPLRTPIQHLLFERLQYLVHLLLQQLPHLLYDLLGDPYGSIASFAQFVSPTLNEGNEGLVRHHPQVFSPRHPWRSIILFTTSSSVVIVLQGSRQLIMVAVASSSGQTRDDLTQRRKRHICVTDTRYVVRQRHSATLPKFPPLKDASPPLHNSGSIQTPQILRRILAQPSSVSIPGTEKPASKRGRRSFGRENHTVPVIKHYASVILVPSYILVLVMRGNVASLSEKRRETVCEDGKCPRASSVLAKFTFGDDASYEVEVLVFVVSDNGKDWAAAGNVPKYLDVTDASNVSEEAHKIQVARVNRLLLGADRLLNTPHADTIQPYLLDRISDEKFHNTYRAVAFARLIRFALQRRLFGVAIAVYNKMLHEGFMPISSIRVRMEALKIVEGSTELWDSVVPLKKLFDDKAYGPDAFMELLDFLQYDKRASAVFLDDLAQVYLSAHEVPLSEHAILAGELARINLLSKRPVAAEKWIKKFESICSTDDVRPDTAPYADLIDAIKELDPRNWEAIQSVLQRMKSKGVPPDITIFNALIRANLTQKRYTEAFALYHVLMQKKRSPDLMPNDVTFKMLLKATLLISYKRISVSRMHRRPDNAVSHRKIFRDMLDCHLQETNSQPLARCTVLSVSAFHRSLRTFMELEDYPAALTLLVRGFPTFGFPLNLQSYLIVLTSLLHRMKRELGHVRQEGEHRLADFFMHIRPDEPVDFDLVASRIERGEHIVDFGASSPAWTKALAHLLELGDIRQTVDSFLDDVDAPSRSGPTNPQNRRQQTAVMPTVEQLTGAHPTPPHTYFSPTPLVRILQKTLLGVLFKKAQQRGEGWDWKAAASAIVREMTEELIPPISNERDERTREHIRVREGLLPFSASRMRRRKRTSARGGKEISLE
ncbi:hypothetical protein F5I97DRAFT_1827766 [Phlebopus sp. FC_14]|nr:hypothetical protein F5I97DRAFT_1827766 [Phlebopus sp. FC_14]